VSEKARPKIDSREAYRNYIQLLRGATVVPAGLAGDGLPVGVQIVGPQYGDLTCIHFARLLEREFQGFIPPPGFE
jgi:Asp-tRNA(Asn)/Glu-tRNA(Gln) amidotransferase A subunit family amidase